MSSDNAPTLSTDVVQDVTGADDVVQDGATDVIQDGAGVSPATDVLSGLGSPVPLPARTVILPGEAAPSPTLAGAATAPFVTAPPGSAPASFAEFASMLASVMQQANAAGSRAAPQPPQPYKLDSNIVGPGTVSRLAPRLASPLLRSVLEAPMPHNPRLDPLWQQVLPNLRACSGHALLHLSGK
jgi:hypothetical protein